MAAKIPFLSLKQSGVGLLEFVIGLVLLAIILLGVTLFFASQKQQLEPVFQYRAVALVEALAEQVLSVKFDANNNPFTQTRCGIGDAESCANQASASEGAGLSDFTQLDDFQLWCKESGINGQQLAQDLNLSRPELYHNFVVNSCVEPISEDESTPYKRVTIIVNRGSSEHLRFQLQRYNIR